MKSSRRLFLLNFVLYATIFLTLANNQSSAKEILSIGAIPDQNPEHLNRLYKLLSSYLSNKLKIPVRYVPVTNYPAAVSAFRTGNLDLVWFGGLTGTQARIQKPGSQVLAQRDIDRKFQSLFIANQASNIPIIKKQSDLSVLKNKRLTFGSESSTSGRLMPQHYLQEVGVNMNDFKGKRPGFSGSHDATIALVHSGSYEVGALNKQVWEANLKKERIDLSKVKVIWETPTYADYHWLAQPDLDKRFGDGFTTKLKMALLDIGKSSTSDSEILELFGAKKFVSADESNYIEIERIGRQLGKIK